MITQCYKKAAIKDYLKKTWRKISCVSGREGSGRKTCECFLSFLNWEKSLLVNNLWLLTKGNCLVRKNSMCMGRESRILRVADKQHASAKVKFIIFTYQMTHHVADNEDHMLVLLKFYKIPEVFHDNHFKREMLIVIPKLSLVPRNVNVTPETFQKL